MKSEIFYFVSLQYLFILTNVFYFHRIDFCDIDAMSVRVCMRL